MCKTMWVYIHQMYCTTNENSQSCRGANMRWLRTVQKKPKKNIAVGSMTCYDINARAEHFWAGWLGSGASVTRGRAVFLADTGLLHTGGNKVPTSLGLQGTRILVLASKIRHQWLRATNKQGKDSALIVEKKETSEFGRGNNVPFPSSVFLFSDRTTPGGLVGDGGRLEPQTVALGALGVWTDAGGRWWMGGRDT